jgi:hypothetical protein
MRPAEVFVRELRSRRRHDQIAESGEDAYGLATSGVGVMIITSPSPWPRVCGLTTLLRHHSPGSHPRRSSIDSYTYRGLGHEQIARGLNPQETARNHGDRAGDALREVAANQRHQQHLRLP